MGKIKLMCSFLQYFLPRLFLCNVGYVIRHNLLLKYIFQQSEKKKKYIPYYIYRNKKNIKT